MRVILSEGCVCGVVGPVCLYMSYRCDLWLVVCVELNSLGWLTRGRESRVDGSCAWGLGVVPK